MTVKFLQYGALSWPTRIANMPQILPTNKCANAQDGRGESSAAAVFVAVLARIANANQAITPGMPDHSSLNVH